MALLFKKIIVFILFLTSSTFLVAQEKETLYYKNGSPRAEGYHENGIKTGRWIYFFPNGNTSSLEEYQDGQLHGQVRYFYEDGQLMAIENWQDGLQQDSSLYYYPNSNQEKKAFFGMDYTKARGFSTMKMAP